MRGQGLFLSKQKGTERTREGRKWVFCPVQTPAFHTNPGITNQHGNAYFLPCSILFPRECASPSPLPWRPLAHIQGSCILCCSGTARMRAFCCNPVGVTNAGRGVSQQVESQPRPAARARSVRGRSRKVGHVSMYVYTHNNGLCCVWTVSPST